MRPIKLEIKGINSFREKTIIDFSELMSNSHIFGIFGKTGSGKSSILDCIFLALYNKVIRNKEKREFINLSGKESYVIFDFSVLEKGKSRKYYRIKRNYKLNPDGTVEEDAVMFAIPADKNGELVKLGEGAETVNRLAVDAIGHTEEGFRTYITIHQGEFARLLKSPINEQIKFIGEMFELDAYGDRLENELKTEKNECEKKVEYYKGILSQYENLSEADIAATGKQLKETEFKQKEAKLNYDITKIDLLKGEKEFILKEEIAENKKELAGLDTQRKEYDEDIRRLNVLRFSFQINPIIENLNDIEFSLKEKEVALKDVDERLNKINETKATRSETEEAKSQIMLETARLEDKKQVLIRALESESVCLKLEGKRAKLNKELVTQRQKANHLNSVYILECEKLEKINTDIKQIRANLEDVRLPENVFADILNYESLAGEIDIYVKRGEFLEAKLADSIARRQADEKELSVYDVENSELLDKIAGYEHKIKKLYGEDADLYAIAAGKARKEAFLISESRKYLDIINKLKDLNNELREIDADILRAQEAEKIENSKVNDYNASYNQLLDKKEKLTRERNQAFSGDVVNFLKENAKFGDSCPVCGDTIRVRLNANNNTDYKEIEFEIENLESRAIETLSLRDKSLLELGAAKSVLAILKHRKEDLIAKIIMTEKDRDIILENNPGFINADELYFKGLLQTISSEDAELKQLLSDLSRLKITQSSSERKCTQFGSSILELEEYIDFINTEVDFNTSKLHILNEAALKFENNFKEGDIKQIAKDAREKKMREEALRREEAALLNKQSVQSKVKDEAFIEYELALVDQKNIENQINNLTEDIISEKEIIANSGIVNSAKEDLEQVENRLERLKSDKDLLLERTTRGVKEETELRLKKSSLISDHVLTKKNYDNIKQAIDTELKRAGIRKEEIINDVNYNEIVSLERKVSTFEKQYGEIADRISRLNKLTSGSDITETKLAKLKQSQEEAEAKYMDYYKNVEWLKMKLNEQNENIVKVNKFRIEQQQNLDRLDRINEILELTQDEKFLKYVAEDYIMNLINRSNKHLGLLTTGRYQLVYDKEIVVADNLFGANRRSLTTLSGGETFLASLSLAISIAENLTKYKKQKLEFMFLDEGFGTLDNESLETVMNALINLKDSGFTIGIISHEDVVKSRVVNKIEVFKYHDSNGVNSVIQ